MSRYTDKPDSVYSQSDFITAGILNCVATGAINAGELCMLNESGQIQRVDPALPWASINQSDPSPYQVFITAKWVTVTLTTMTIAKACGYPVRCRNINAGSAISRTYAVPVQSSAGVGFVLRTAAGLEISNYINVSADVSTTIPYTVPLQNGTFVLIWHVGAVMKFAIYDQFATQIKAPTIVSSAVLTSGMVPWHGHAILGNGNFAITWATTGGALVGIIYGPTGSVVVAQFTIDAASAGQAHVCAPCANGDFLIGCYDSSHTKHSLYRCTNAGSVSWGPIARSPATSPFSWPDAARQHPQHNRLCELLNGAGGTSLPNICWNLPNSGGYCNSYVHDHLGALVKAVDIGVAYHNINCQDPVTQTPQGFCVAHAPSPGNGTYISYFDYLGNPCGQNTLVESGGRNFPPGQTPNIAFYTGWCGTGVGISRYYGGASFGGVECRVIHADQQGNCIGTPYNHQPFGPDDICAPAPNCDFDGTAHLITFTSSTLQISASLVKVGRSSVIGVAQADAADGANVTIVSEGYFPLPASQTFGPGCAFDQRMAPVPGARGVVSGRIAVLFGWSGSVASPPALPPGAPSPVLSLAATGLTPGQVTTVVASLPPNTSVQGRQATGPGPQ